MENVGVRCIEHNSTPCKEQTIHQKQNQVKELQFTELNFQGLEKMTRSEGAIYKS
jgi:CMP-N-acetylneuraminic acid synthetase